jgi:alpha-1,6-mannosyltransferase
MKVCDIASFYSPLGGGIKRYLREKRRYFAERPPWEHTLVIPSHQDTVSREAAGSVYEIRSPRLLGSRAYRLLLSRPRIEAAIEAEAPDLIEVGDAYRSAWIGLRAARRRKLPIVAFYHSDFPRALGRTVRRFAGPPGEALLSPLLHRYVLSLYNRLDATVVAGEKLRQTLADCGFRNLVRIPLGTDVQTFRPRDSRAGLRRELALNPSDRLLLFVGRLGREKNIGNLVRLLDHLPTESRTHLLLVGEGELDDFVRDEACRRPHLHWMPYSNSSDRLAEIYSGADLLVHAGTWETFGIVSLEAQACGTRVLAVRHGGLDETVAGEPSPVMAEGSDAPALALGVAKALAIPETQGDRDRRRARIVEEFSIKITFQRLTALYAHLIEGGAADTFNGITKDHRPLRDPAV